jgi:hypothetical protein
MTHSPNTICTALRLGTLFAVLGLSPATALADNLIDYGGDYTDAAVVPAAPIQTDYRVGRGYVPEEKVAVSPDRAAAVDPSEPVAARGSEHR